MTPARKLRLTTIVLGAVILAAAVGIWRQVTYYPKRFAPVVEGRLYRSGEVSPLQLGRIQQDFGIGRVVCLLNPEAPETQAERAAAERLGIEWLNIPLTGDGASNAADRARIAELLLDENAPPTLVHCSAGVNRTGLAVGLYRIHAQNWSYDQVLGELRRLDFDDLPKHENLRSALRAAAEERAAQSQPAGSQP